MKLNYLNARLRICVDELENMAVGGRVYCQRLSEPLVFADLGEMLLQIDALLDALNYPRAYQKKRSFGPPLPFNLPISDQQLPLAQDQGKLASFELNITARQYAGWQGTLDWRDVRPAQSFSSERELLLLLDQELQKISNPQNL